MSNRKLRHDLKIQQEKSDRLLKLVTDLTGIVERLNKEISELKSRPSAVTIIRETVREPVSVPYYPPFPGTTGPLPLHPDTIITCHQPYHGGTGQFFAGGAQ